jgi:hypothetical protein
MNFEHLRKLKIQHMLNECFLAEVIQSILRASLINSASHINISEDQICNGTYRPRILRCTVEYQHFFALFPSLCLCPSIQPSIRLT